MPSFLVTYGTGHGQTERVAGRIGSVLADRGHDVTTLPVADASTMDVGKFDAVLVGSPVVNRRHLPEVVEFVERNRAALEARPSAFFQLSLASIVPGRWAEEGSKAFVEQMVAATGWQPDRVGRFAGAVAYTQYDRPTRWVFKLVSMVTTGDTDTSRDYEYTDWDEVERFATELGAYAEDRLHGTADGRRYVAAVGRRGALALAVLGVVLAGAAYRLVARGRASRLAAAERPDSGTNDGRTVPATE